MAQHGHTGRGANELLVEGGEWAEAGSGEESETGVDERGPACRGGMTEILRQWRNCYGLLTGFGASCRCPQERSANATQGGGENMWDGE